MVIKEEHKKQKDKEPLSEETIIEMFRNLNIPLI